jgi:hypothetical protein
MQEEIVDKSIDVAARITNLTLSQILKALDTIIKGLEKKPDEKTPEQPKDPELKEGKQTLKELHKHNEGLANIELTNPNLRELNKYMKKADIDFSCVKDGKGKYTLFFKGKNEDEMTHAFKRYTQKMIVREDKKAIKLDLKIAKSLSQEFNRLDKEKNKEQRSRIKIKNRGTRDR